MKHIIDTINKKGAILIMFLLFYTVFLSSLSFSANKFDQDNPDTWDYENFKDNAGTIVTSENLKDQRKYDIIKTILSENPELFGELTSEQVASTLNKAYGLKLDVGKVSLPADGRSIITRFSPGENPILETTSAVLEGATGLFESIIGIASDGSFLFSSSEGKELKISGKLTLDANTNELVLTGKDGFNPGKIGELEVQGRIDPEQFKKGIIKGVFSRFMGFRGVNNEDSLVLTFYTKTGYLTFHRKSIVGEFPLARSPEIKRILGEFKVDHRYFPTGKFDVLEEDSFVAKFYRDNDFLYKYKSVGKTTLRFTDSSSDSIKGSSIADENTITFYTYDGELGEEIRIIAEGITKGAISRYDLEPLYKRDENGNIVYDRNGRAVVISLDKDWETDSSLTNDQKEQIRARIKAMKKFFTEKGLYTGSIDTEWNQEFDKAVHAYQTERIGVRARGEKCIGSTGSGRCSSDGVIGPRTMDYIDDDTYYRFQLIESHKPKIDVQILSYTRVFFSGEYAKEKGYQAQQLTDSEVQVVRELEKYLKEHDYLDREPTGKYDSDFVTALNKFQQVVYDTSEDKRCLGSGDSKSCSPDGMVGKKVIGYISDELYKQSQERQKEGTVGSKMLLAFSEDNDGKPSGRVELAGKVLVDWGGTHRQSGKYFVATDGEHYYKNPGVVKDNSHDITVFGTDKKRILDEKLVEDQDVDVSSFYDISLDPRKQKIKTGSTVVERSRSGENIPISSYDGVFYSERVIKRWNAERKKHVYYCAETARKNIERLASLGLIDKKNAFINDNAGRLEDKAIGSGRAITTKKYHDDPGKPDYIHSQIVKQMNEEGRDFAIYQTFSMGTSTYSNGEKIGHVSVTFAQRQTDGSIKLFVFDPYYRGSSTKGKSWDYYNVGKKENDIRTAVLIG
jgi:hypothetical protein